MNPFPYTKGAATAKAAQDNANHHWYEKMGAQDILAEAEDYLEKFRGDSVARAAAITAARDAHDGVRHHERENAFWTRRAASLRGKEAAR